MVYIGVKYTVTALCTVPAFFLSVATGLLEESAVYLYKSDKIHAFWIINKITKINNIAPILVDLSQSTWLNYENYTISLIETMLHVKTRCKLLLGILFMFTFFFNAKLSQLSLDEFTSSTERGLIMNITSAVATLSAILLLAKFNSGKYFIISLLSVLTVVIYIAFKSLGWNSKVAEIVLSVILRYFSNLSYGIFIIWAIETFPTICRAQCLSFVLCGCSFATMLAYGLNNFETILLCISLVLNLLIMGSLKFLNANQNKKLLDTLHGEYYD